MDRRQFIINSGLSAASLSLPVEMAHAAEGDAAINALFEKIFNENLRNAPTLASALGLDRGANADLKSKLGSDSAAERKRDMMRNMTSLAALKAIGLTGLSESSKVNRAVVMYQLEGRILPPARFGIDSVQRPYRIFQQGGAYFSVPDFLNTAHSISTKEDCEAYLSRLSAFAHLLDEDTVEQRAQAARGFLAPGWSIDLTLGQMTKLREQAAATSSMANSLVGRAGAKGLTGDWRARATKIVEAEVYPALDRQMALMKGLRGKARAGDGAWRLNQGAAIYAAALEQATTTKFSADEVHNIGLEQVAELSAQLDAILKSAGLTQGPVGARLSALNVRPEQLYTNSAEGRAALIASLNEGVRAMYARLPQAFATLPTQPLEIRAVPTEIQDGASNGYYRSAALDGSRPAIYFINLKDVGDWPKYSLPSLTFHEGVPGHHLQISLAQESKDIPMIRKLGGFSAYSEGWALYSEQLADELGSYSGIEKAGYLQSFLFRASRLVIDTGIHAKRWSREKATDYMVETTGFARPRCQREVERYCTQIGQACSYKIGHIAWTRARAMAQAALGAKFDVKEFHEVLKEGAMPLTFLEERIAARTTAAAS